MATQRTTKRPLDRFQPRTEVLRASESPESHDLFDESVEAAMDNEKAAGLNPNLGDQATELDPHREMTSSEPTLQKP